MAVEHEERCAAARGEDPSPLAPGDGRAFEAALAAQGDFRACFEALLVELSEERADRLAHMLRAVRGVWAALAASPGLLDARAAGGRRALLVGNALSGAAVALAAVGWQVVLCDPSRERLAFASAHLAYQRSLADALTAGLGDARARALPAPPLAVQAGSAGLLPFAGRAFALVVLEEGPGVPAAATLAEARRVAAGELLVLADNRLGYKRASGRTWDFRVRGPLEFARRALARGSGERTLRGWRRHLAHAELAPGRELALYPHRRDFAFVVALDGPFPALPIGPNEQKNRWKTAAHAAGLFPLLTPSFALGLRRRERPPARSLGEHVLAELCARLGEPPAEIEHLVGTRGDLGLWLTRPSGSERAERSPGARERTERSTGARERGELGPGALALHLALHAHHRSNLARHAAGLAHLRAAHPRVPVPAILFAGPLAGVWLTAERRLAGVAAHQGLDARRAEALLANVGLHLAALGSAPPRPLDAAESAALVERRFERVRARIAGAEARARLERLAGEVREAFAGLALARVFQHGDLRAKHVQVDAAGRVLGYLDFATHQENDLPLLDLLHLWVHVEKQLSGRADRASWRAFQAGELGDGAGRAFEAYARSLGLGADERRALALFYPVWIGWIAETFRAYSRPRWFERTFAL